MATYGICRLEKYGKGQIGGIDAHNNRRSETSKTNPNIDRTRTHLNYNLHDNNKPYFSKKVKEILKEKGIETKPRKNAVLVAELLFTASPKFFEEMSQEQIREYFSKCYSWACKKYGKSNIISAEVHLDESTPHMHLDFVPLVPDKKKGGYKLCANDLFNHTLDELQDQVHKEVFSGYGLDRGITDKERQHYSTLNYKILTMQTKEQKLRQEITTLEEQKKTNELFKVKEQLKKVQDMLCKMFDVLESDPLLMQEYRIAAQRYKASQNRNMDEPEI